MVIGPTGAITPKIPIPAPRRFDTPLGKSRQSNPPTHGAPGNLTEPVLPGATRPPLKLPSLRQISSLAVHCGAVVVAAKFAVGSLSAYGGSNMR
jgi:hypothetical protein